MHEPNDLSEGVSLLRLAAAIVGKAVTNIPLSDEDAAVLDFVEKSPPSKEGSFFFEVISNAGHAITAGLWSFFIQVIIRNWRTTGKDIASVLPNLREVYESDGDRAANRLIDAAAETLESLSYIDDEGRPQNDEAGSPETLGRRMRGLAQALEDIGDRNLAYDLAALGLDLLPSAVRSREELATYALELAIKAEKGNQIAACSTALAASIAAAADSAPERRVDAFDAFEIAIERLRAAEQPFQLMLAQHIASEINGREYLKTLLIPVWFFLPDTERPKGFRAAVGAESWPQRFSQTSRDTWSSELNVLWTAQMWDLEIEKARLALEPSTQQERAYADWATLKLHHPAFRRAVPQSRSFLREAEFDEIFLVLSHELTHVLSILGGIGAALIGLQVALINGESVLWSMQSGEKFDSERMKERIALEGPAPLQAGELGLLFRVEQSLELTLKAKMLQDIWTPWFEGLAIFGESAADPSLDELRIGAVTQCLRNLVDFDPTPDAQGRVDQASMVAEFEQFAQEFESRCSAAIARRGPKRLNTYLRSSNPSYFAGYLAVRSVVAAWRESTGRPLSGTEVFSLLLHATRYGTLGVVPDLSLLSGSFDEAARQMMLDWVHQLAELPADDINGFLQHSNKSDPGRLYEWRDGRLLQFDPKARQGGAQDQEVLTERLRQALSSLTREGDEGRVQTSDPLEQIVLSRGREVCQSASIVDLSRWKEGIDGLYRLSGLLPIGQTEAKFFANNDPESPWSVLAVQIRTTERSATGDGPSVNGFWFNIDAAAAEQIKLTYHRTGKPRIQVSRIIDLGGFFSSSLEPGQHFLAFSYGDWFEIRGGSSIIDESLRKDENNRSYLKTVTRRRLYPEPLVHVLQEIISRGDAGAKRTVAWIDTSEKWSLRGHSYPVENWVKHVRQLAERTVSFDHERVDRQRELAASLIDSLLGDPEVANMVVTGGFELLTEQFPTKREQIVDALFKTAESPKTVLELGPLAFGTEKTPILIRGLHGWDVHPSIRTQSGGQDGHIGSH